MLRSCHQMEWMNEIGPYLLVSEILATLACAYEQCGDPDCRTNGKRHLRLDCLFFNKIFRHIKKYTVLYREFTTNRFKCHEVQEK